MYESRVENPELFNPGFAGMMMVVEMTTSVATLAKLAAQAADGSAEAQAQLVKIAGALGATVEDLAQDSIGTTLGAINRAIAYGNSQGDAN